MHFHRRVWYHVLSLRYACIQHLGIILISFTASIAELACGEKSRTQSINHSPSLSDAQGTEAFASEHIFIVLFYSTLHIAFRCIILYIDAIWSYDYKTEIKAYVLTYVTSTRCLKKSSHL